MIHFISRSSISIQMGDHSAPANGLMSGLGYRDHWLYLVGLLIILILIIKIILGISRGRSKARVGFIRPFPAQNGRLFSIYYRDPSSKSIQFRGKVIERRLKERGNNFKDLLGKVRRDYSYRVIDPNGIFLQASNYKKDRR